MSRIDWSSIPVQYESGVDRGVLYPPNGSGVVWNGLVSVEESYVGGGVEAYHFDGVKYLEKAAPRNYQAKVTAFSAPNEFSELMGELPVVPGFILTRQPRKQFGFSYRTMLGGDGDYKLHVIYNATASTESRGYATKDGSAFAASFSWKFDAVPPKLSGYRPSAHFTLDTTKTDLFTLRAIEDILYGTATSEPRLPSVEELVDIVGLWEPKLIVPAVDPSESLVNLVKNSSFELGTTSWTKNGSGAGLTHLTNEGPEDRDAVRLSWDGSTWASITQTITPQTIEPFYASAKVRGLQGGGRTAKLRLIFYSSAWANLGQVDSDVYAFDSSEYVTLELSASPPAGTQYIATGVHTFSPVSAAGEIDVADNLVSTGVAPYFDGNTPDDLEYTYEWTGTPHDSTSVRKTRPVAYLTPGLGDLTPSRVPGLLRELPTTRLAETAVGGLYRLE